MELTRAYTGMVGTVRSLPMTVGQDSLRGHWYWNRGLFDNQMYDIIATDYITFAFVYGCEDYLFGLFHY
jgi:hypothetical protein